MILTIWIRLTKQIWLGRNHYNFENVFACHFQTWFHLRTLTETHVNVSGIFVEKLFVCFPWLNVLSSFVLLPWLKRADIEHMIVSHAWTNGKRANMKDFEFQFATGIFPSSLSGFPLRTTFVLSFVLLLNSCSFYLDCLQPNIASS